MYRVQRAQGAASKPKKKAYTASLLRMERTFKESDLDKVKLKQNFDDGSSKKREVPVYDGGDSGLEGLLYCAEKFTDAASALIFDTGDELFEHYGSTLTGGARDTWLTVLTDNGIVNNTGDKDQFNQCFTFFLLAYSNDKAKNNVRKYLLDDKNPELKKEHDADVHQHGMRYRTLCRYSRMLQGTCTDITEDEEKEGLLTCFPEEWQNNYNLGRDVSDDGFSEILTFMKREKNKADRHEDNKSRNMYGSGPRKRGGPRPMFGRGIGNRGMQPFSGNTQRPHYGYYNNNYGNYYHRGSGRGRFFSRGNRLGGRFGNRFGGGRGRFHSGRAPNHQQQDPSGQGGRAPPYQQYHYEQGRDPNTGREPHQLPSATSEPHRNEFPAQAAYYQSTDNTYPYFA